MKKICKKNADMPQHFAKKPELDILIRRESIKD